MLHIRNCLLALLIFFTQVAVAQSPLPIKKDGKWGAIDTNGKILIEPKYEFIGPFGKVASGEFWAYFRLDEQTGVMNEKGKEVVKPEYEQAKIYASGAVAVWQKGKVGLVVNGELAVQPEYDMVEPLVTDGTLLRTTFNNKYGVSDLTGKVVHTCVFDRLDIAQKGAVIATISQNGKFGAMEVIGGQLILPAEFDKVEVSAFGATGYKLKQIVEVVVDETGSVTKQQAYNNQTDFDLTKRKLKNAKIKEELAKNP